MEEHTYKELQIDERFQRLVYPMDRQSFAQLEADILSGHCVEPLVVWNGFLIGGFSQYKVYSEHQLAFCTKEIEFNCREAAVAWICVQQLKRSDIPDALRRFLIGIQYRSEAAAVKLFRDEKAWFQNGREPICQQIAARIAEENHIALETVKRFSSFAATLEDIRLRAPKAVEEIMYGRVKIADKHLLQLSRLNDRSFQRVLHQLGSTQQSLVSRSAGRRTAKNSDNTSGRAVLGPSVKDMPAFDPDAEVTGLALTIPSWSGSIDRTIGGTDLSIVSAQAKARLASALLDLQGKTAEMLMAIGVE